MSEYKQYFSAIVILLLIGAVTYFIGNRIHPPTEGPVEATPGNISSFGSAPTTFAQDGLITFDQKENVVSSPHFTYITMDGNTATTTLVFDELSFCVAQNGSAPCMAMSVTLDLPFGNKQAVVEGVTTGNQVLVRKLRVVGPEETPLVPGTGSVFITWPQAVSFIESCAVKMVTQTHALDIFLTFKDNTQLRTVEPVIDEVFRVTDRAKQACGDTIVATE